MRKNNNYSLEELLEIEKRTHVMSEEEFLYHYMKNKIAFFLVNFLGPFTGQLCYNLMSDLSPYTLFSLVPFDIMLPIVINNLYEKIKYKSFSYINCNAAHLKYRENLPIFKALSKNYDEFLEKVLYHLDKLPMEHDTLNTILAVSEYLLPNGYLSVTDSFSNSDFWKLYDDYICESCYNLDGACITTGLGCCRNVNGFVSDLLNKKGVDSYQICGFVFNELEEYQQCDFCKGTPNHLIIGYVEQGKFHYVDSSNSFYSIIQDKEYYQFCDDSNQKIFVPDYVCSSQLIQQPSIPAHFPYMPAITEIELEERKKDLLKMMLLEGYQKSNQFKKDNSDTILKISTLVSLEYGRTKEKENQKIKH